MPCVEIDSPLTGSQMALNFPINGTCDAADSTNVTCTVTGGGLAQPATFTATVTGGIWSATTNLGATATGTAYTIVASAPDCGSDEVDEITAVPNTPNIVIKAPPPPPPPRRRGRHTLDPDVPYPLSGTYLTLDTNDLDSTIVLVLLHVFKGRKHDVVYSGGSAALVKDNSTTPTWTWSITLPAPPTTNKGRLVVQSIRIDPSTNKVLDQTSLKIK